ncbi:PH domain-containing protein [Oceanobacillus luteolus]|uniref:PH domain-containing protein n=1 Tax=Oceanobacillus luteolus TaxID=1274358 RepID=A0ABW4HWF7_9BACI|nr:PH domain-containing protein [Oceanobacillus luteolus]MCM3742195.1 PH domain-containing protein [Oceanobacillus luteolus]
MRQPPQHLIDPRALKVWKISAVLYTGIIWVLLIVGAILTIINDWSMLYIIISIFLHGIISYLFIFLFPKLRYRRWRYEIFEQEIYIQHGIFIMTRTLVPMIRVQHVDTEQGPLMKKYHVASVSISTAATTHVIPALSEDDASDLRDRISQLARVDEDDV